MRVSQEPGGPVFFSVPCSAVVSTVGAAQISFLVKFIIIESIAGDHEVIMSQY